LPTIYKVVVNRFDQEYLAERFNVVKDLPVKLVINCKNSKRKNIKQSSKPRKDEERGEDDYD